MARKTNAKPKVVAVAMPTPAEPIDAALAPWMAECAQLIPNWAATPEARKRQIAAQLRDYMESPAPPSLTLSRGEDGKWQSSAPQGTDELINLLGLHGAFRSPSASFVYDRVP